MHSPAIPGDRHTRLRRIAGFPIFLALRVCSQAAPGSTAVVLLIAVFVGLVPVGLYVAVALFAGEVARDPQGARLEVWVPLIAGLYFVLQGSGSLLNHLIQGLARRVDAWLQHGVMGAAIQPGTVGHLDTPSFRNAAELARNWEASAYPPSEAVESLVEVVKAAVVASGSIVLVAAFSWWVPLVLSCGFILMTVWGARVRETGTGAGTGASGLRRAQYLRDQAFEPAGGRESRVFSLAGWFRSGSDRDWTRAMTASGGNVPRPAGRRS